MTLFLRGWHGNYDNYRLKTATGKFPSAEPAIIVLWTVGTVTKILVRRKFWSGVQTNACLAVSLSPNPILTLTLSLTLTLME